MEVHGIRRAVVVVVVVAGVSACGATVFGDLILTTVQSTNWSGYAVASSKDSVNYVSGKWIVPTVTASTESRYSASWVGIDGYGSSTVEQTGTLAISSGSTVSYSAWYEMYPNSMVTIPTMSVHAGDEMSASVTWITSGGHANTFQLTLADVTTGRSYTTYQATSSSIERSSAEWIFEAPSNSGGVLPLSYFTSAEFLDSQVSINGIVGGIDNDAWDCVKLNMVDPQGGTAYPSGLTATSAVTSSFTIYASIPEPATCALVLLGGFGLLRLRRRRAA